MMRSLAVRQCHLHAAALLVALMAASASEAADSPANLHLRWKNDDVLPGQILEIDASRVHFQSPLFVSPFRIDARALNSARCLTRASSTTAKEPCRLTLRSGDVLHGRVDDLTALEIVWKSRRHGVCRIARDQILAFRRCDRAEYAALEDTYVGRSRVHLVGSAFPVHGEVVRLEKSTGRLIVNELSGAVRRVRFDEVAAVYLGDDGATDVAGDPRIQIAYHDGSRVRGRVERTEGGTLLVRTVYSSRAVPCPLAGIREIKFLSDEKSTESGGGDKEVPATMELASGRLHVTLAEGGDTDAALAWRPKGSSSASALAAGVPAKVTFDERNGKPEPEEGAFSDILYLHAGDVTPCRVLSIGQNDLRAELAFGEESSVPLSEVKAIEFETRLRRPVSGFADPGWKEVEQQKGALERTDDKVVFHGPAMLGHANILYGDEIRFDLRWKATMQAMLHVDVFANRMRGRKKLMLYVLGDRLLVSLQHEGGQQRFLVQGQARGSRASIRIDTRDDRLRLFVDDRPSGEMPFPESERTGEGFVMATEGQQIMVVRGVARNSPLELTVSNFEIGWSGDGIRRLRIDEDAKKMILTVPRQRKKNPPTHVLVARNRDLLRGRLTALDGRGVHFVSGMDDLTVPRERLAGIIWLDGMDEMDGMDETDQMEEADTPEDEEPEPPDPPVRDGRARAVLRNGTTLTFTPVSVENGWIVGRSDLLGACRVAVKDLHQLELERFSEPGPVAYGDWKLIPAPEPKFATLPGSDGAPAADVDSPLLGQVAKKIDLELVGGGKFHLGDHANTVVVLDFWATWCGPCVKSLPQIMRAVEGFSSDQVILMAINQQESPATVSEFLKRRGWDLRVALDRDGSVGRDYGVDAIPRTVIVSRSGRIEWLHVGAHPDLRETLEEVLRKLVAEEPTKEER